MAFDVLKSRNACVPISTLPAEIFSSIVLLVAQDDRPDWHIVGKKFRVLSKGGSGWLGLTRVCKRWRTMCQGSPDLWRVSDDPDPYFSAASTVSTTATQRLIPAPPTFPALGSFIYHTSVVSTMPRP